jgi:hypothetical protein
MNELTTMTELNDKELDAVGGGFLNHVRQSNWSLQVPVAINNGSGEAEATARSFQRNSISVDF